MRCLNLNQRIRTIRQRFRQHQPALLIGIEGIQHHRGRIINILRDQIAGRIVNLETNAGCSDQVSGFHISLLHTDMGSDGSVIENVIVGLSVFINEYGEILYKGFAFLALNLMHHIDTIGQVFGFCIPILVRSQNIPFGLPGIGIRTGRSQINLKDSTLFRFLDDTGIVHIHHRTCGFYGVIQKQYRCFGFLCRHILRFGFYLNRLCFFLRNLYFRFCCFRLEFHCFALTFRRSFGFYRNFSFCRCFCFCR